MNIQIKNRTSETRNQNVEINIKKNSSTETNSNQSKQIILSTEINSNGFDHSRIN